MKTSIDECPDCASLTHEYEAATFEQARIHNALGIAEHCRDQAAMRRLTLEAYDATARRTNARAALARHRAAAHGSESMTMNGTSA